MHKHTVLITGCCGYIGNRLTRRLLESGRWKVYGIDNLMYNQELSLLGVLGHPDFIFFPIDIRETERIALLYNQVDAIVPLAAVVGAPTCDNCPEYADQVNRQVIERMVELTSQFVRIVFPTTNSGYGHTSGSECVDEYSPLNPISHYGRTKCAAEKAILQHPWAVSLRLATVFGVSERMRYDLLVQDFVHQLMRQKSLTIYEPHYVRSLVHIEDVVRCVIYMLENHSLRGVYNVVGENLNLSKLELAYQICDLLNIPRDAVTIGEGSDPDQRNYKVSDRKLRSNGFQCKHSLADGVYPVAMATQLLTPPRIARMRNT